jgi:dethiobiotin synthetase
MKLKEKIYFIAAIGTDIGKTFLVENLCRILPNVMAIKPIASGFNDDDKNSDSAKILAALNLEISLTNIIAITPWRFKEALSPHFAAQISGNNIDFSAVKKFCEEKISEAKNSDNFLFIEAAGGVMTPINNNHTFLDLAAELQIPVLLLSANYLGSISHTLCAIEALKCRELVIEKIIINSELPLQTKSAISTVDTIKNFSGIETVLLKNFLD